MPSKNATSVRAFGYVRVSTEEQVEEGISLRSQRARIKAYALAHGLDLVRTYGDEGISGSTLERPRLQKLLDQVKGAQGETIIVYRLSRLSRSTRDLLFLVEDVFIKGHTRLVSVYENIDTHTALGRFFLTIMGALAQMERELISERTRATLQFKKSQGERLGAAPYGYRFNDKRKLVQDRSELAVVRRMVRLRNQGFSYQDIAEKLNELRLKTKRGGKWHASTVRYILKHPMHQKLLK
jgi:site-specific DNA recombinase